tara:strand:+ start:585 stop:944 length:360 start_codon:yes stop_codon:yes gene_type:complete
MPTKKKRIGFIPKVNVLKVIDDISAKENLSNSKVVNILLEEALYTRGLIKETDELYHNRELNDFINNISDLQKEFYENELKFKESKEEFMQSKSNTRIYIRFIQFLYFKKMMNVFEQFC